MSMGRQRTHWRDPLVSSEFSDSPPPQAAPPLNESWYDRNGHIEEDNFFSPEFYQAFPHLKYRKFPSRIPIPRDNDKWLQFTSHLDRFDSNWRDDPFWRDLYPRWAEPIFKGEINL